MSLSLMIDGRAVTQYHTGLSLYSRVTRLPFENLGNCRSKCFAPASMKNGRVSTTGEIDGRITNACCSPSPNCEVAAFTRYPTQASVSGTVQSIVTGLVSRAASARLIWRDASTVLSAMLNNSTRAVHC